MNRRLPTSTVPRSAASVLAGALLAAGCDGTAVPAADSDARGGLGLSPPAALMQSRAVDRTRLVPRVTLVGTRGVPDRSVPMTRDGERWRGTVDVVPERNYTLDILWIESVFSGERVRELPLATLRGVVAVGPDGALFTVGADEYDFELDLDGDGITNFAEREANTDPFGDGFSIDDPAVPAPDLPDRPAPDDGTPTEPLDELPDAPASETPPPLEPVDPPGDPGPDAPGDVSPLDPAEPIVPVEEPIAPVNADVVIARIAAEDAPGIDGRNVVAGDTGVWGGEWASATSFDTSGRRLFIDRLMIDKGTDETNGQAFRAWSAVHDGEYLYVLVVVDDDGRRVRDSDDDSDEIWRDDSLEVYVDGDNSKNTSYGDGNDSERLLPLLARGTTDQGTSEGIVPAFLSLDAPIRIDFATGPGLGPEGLRRPDFEQDVYELRIDLASAGIVPGRVFGFELQVNDDDDGGDREAKWGWAHPARVDEDVDFTYLDPSFMGTAILE